MAIAVTNWPNHQSLSLDDSLCLSVLLIKSTCRNMSSVCFGCFTEVAFEIVYFLISLLISDLIN